MKTYDFESMVILLDVETSSFFQIQDFKDRIFRLELSLTPLPNLNLCRDFSHVSRDTTKLEREK